MPSIYHLTDIISGAVWLVTQWYEPKRTGLRMSLFYFSSAASGAISGLLAAAIAQMDGLGMFLACANKPC
jgi:hypothetical protein